VQQEQTGDIPGIQSVLHMESIRDLSRDATQDDHTLPGPFHRPSSVVLFHFHLRCLQLFMDNRCLKSRRTQRKAGGKAGKRTKGEQKPNDSLILLKLRPHKSCRNNNSSKQRNKPQSGNKKEEKRRKSREKRGRLKKSTTMGDGR